MYRCIRVLSLVVGIGMLLVACYKHPEGTVIVLEEGDYGWDVFVGGQSTTWQLAYPDYDSVPVHNQDYGVMVRYRGVDYDLWRVSPGQIQVSAPISP